jgi:transposase InsO family protein
MSEKVSAQASSSTIDSVLTKAADVNVSKNASKIFKEKFDTEFQSKLHRLQTYKFRSATDIVNRFPFPGELDDDDGIMSWNGYTILSQDLVQGVLAAEWKEQTPATGRIRFNSYLKQRYIGISSPQITEFLANNDEHQVHRQRRRSQRTKTSVASAPFKQLAMDLTDIPRRGVYRYLFVVVDVFSKYAWVVPLAKKSGEIVARELDKIIQSLPTGARVGSIRSDNGSEFKNPEIRAVLDKAETKQVFGLAGNPLGNGAVEALNRTLKVNLFSELGVSKTVGTYGPGLKKVLKQYNNTIHSSTGYIPSVLNNPSLPPNIIQDVLQKLNKLAKGTDVNARYQPPLMAGDKCRITLEELDNTIKLKIKSKMFKSSHSQVYSSKVYTVLRQDADNFVRIVELPKDKFPRGSILRVNADAKDLDQIEEDDDDDVDEEEAQEPVIKRKRTQQTDFVKPTRVLRSKK